VTFKELQSLVRNGEGAHLEFKKKMNHADKILREIVAFANADGGQLLVGIDDDGTISGVRDAEEVIQTLSVTIADLIQPVIRVHFHTVPITMKLSVVLIRIVEGKNKPYFVLGNRRFTKRAAYYRWSDKSIQASRELTSILKRQRRSKNGYLLKYGDLEDLAIKHLDAEDALTISKFRKLSGLGQKAAAEVLIGLVLANVLKINPRDTEDIYTLKI